MNDLPQLRSLGKALGTEAVVVDLSKLDDATFAWIDSTFADHPVLVFRNQYLAAEDLAAFSPQHRVVKSLPVPVQEQEGVLQAHLPGLSSTVRPRSARPRVRRDRCRAIRSALRRCAVPVGAKT
jgi:alpha-ketoglutarate-dependent taurine dioxygenase